MGYGKASDLWGRLGYERHVEGAEHHEKWVGWRQTHLAPAQTDGTPMKVSSPPPTLGQHNEDLLRELGYDDDAIDMFRTKGVI